MVELKGCYVISCCRDVSLRIKNKLLLKIKYLKGINVTLHTNKKSKVYLFIFFSY
jgi:spore coat polysaccharide biosynthesis protein SpsF (cytidylyltransferase family)